jgi:hypothetical protein
MQLSTVQWLLEHTASSIEEANDAARTVWILLFEHFAVFTSGGNELEGAVFNVAGEERDEEEDAEKNAVIMALLRVMVLRGAPPPELLSQLSPERAQVVQEGERLRARLPAYLAQRQALLEEHSRLIAPLRDLVSLYEDPTNVEDLWALGLGAAP